MDKNSRDFWISAGVVGVWGVFIGCFFHHLLYSVSVLHLPYFFSPFPPLMACRKGPTLRNFHAWKWWRELDGVGDRSHESRARHPTVLVH